MSEILQFADPKDQWKYNAVISGIVKKCLDEKQLYSLHSYELIPALLKGKESQHYEMLKSIPGFDEQFEINKKQLAFIKAAGGMTEKMASQMLAIHEVTAPVYAALLFCKTKFIDQTEKQIFSQFDALFAEVAVLIKKTS